MMSWLKSEYQPNVVGLAFRCLFAAFAKRRIRLTKKDYVNDPASFTALFKARMKHAAKYRPDFARTPDRAYFDPNEDWKIRHQAKPEFNILADWDDLMRIYYWIISTHFMLRGSLEVRSLSVFSSLLLPLLLNPIFAYIFYWYSLRNFNCPIWRCT